MLNKELWLVIVPAYSWFLFAFGGTQISDKIEGQKWLRRFILPLLWALSIFMAGFALWQAILVMLLGIGILHLGYGSKTSWTIRLLVFLGYALISAPIGLSWWNPITFFGCILMFLGSNSLFSATLVWKIVEGFFGLLIGIQISYCLAR